MPGFRLVACLFCLLLLSGCKARFEGENICTQDLPPAPAEPVVEAPKTLQRAAGGKEVVPPSARLNRRNPMINIKTARRERNMAIERAYASIERDMGVDAVIGTFGPGVQDGEAKSGLQRKQYLLIYEDPAIADKQVMVDFKDGKAVAKRCTALP